VPYRDQPRLNATRRWAKSAINAMLRNADDATKRALFDAFDLRVAYDKTGDRLSISATLTEAVASTLRTGPEPVVNRLLRGSERSVEPIHYGCK
jgi:hypothetical protein